MNNVIPPLLDMQLSSWVQPDAKDILVDDGCALMSKASFGLLHDYSHSYPTGVVPGKMWKAYIAPRWYLRWYTEFQTIGDHTGHFTDQRELHISDWEKLMGVNDVNTTQS